jgi:hypothetical protein
MDRRGFLKLLGGTVGGLALAEAIPFNRVWSFPKKIVIAKPDLKKLATIYYDPVAIQALRGNFLDNPLDYGKTYADWNGAINKIVDAEFRGIPIKVKTGLKHPYTFEVYA